MKRTWDELCDKLEKQAKEIERLNRQARTLLDVINDSDKENRKQIERLRKEKEWLIENLAWEYHQNDNISPDEESKKAVIADMHQALKEK